MAYQMSSGISTEVSAEVLSAIALQISAELSANMADSEMEDEVQELKPFVNKIREDLEIAEALARASFLTPASANARLTAKKLQLTIPAEFMPPRMVLIYLVRMGSFHSTPKVKSVDSENDDFFSSGLSIPALIQKHNENKPADCQSMQRYFCVAPQRTHFKYTMHNYDEYIDYDPNSIRVMQWNILAQALGQNYERFVRLDKKYLTWDYRKYQLVEEILRTKPDLICLEEVDHFSFLLKVLITEGYDGRFCEKPDSPCVYIQGNTGADGCAIFFNRKKFKFISTHAKTLEVWGVKSNQIVLLVNLENISTGKSVCLVATHLKAKSGALLTHLRDEQARDLLSFVDSASEGRPFIICGDFNGEQDEPFYQTMHSYKNMGIGSAYAIFRRKFLEAIEPMNPQPSYECPYTTWKIRENGEECRTIDYIFYSKNKFNVKAILQMPTVEEIGINRLPSSKYASDHLSLIADFSLIN